MLKRDEVGAACDEAGPARSAWSPRCLVCGGGFEDRGGRPAVYCSRRCQSARARLVAAAMRDLARGVDPDTARLDEAITAAETLFAAWWATARRRAGTWSAAAETLADRHWAGAPPTRLAPPAPAALRALSGRLTRLYELRAQRDREAQARARRAAWAAPTRPAETEAAADMAWRAELAATAGDGAGEP